MSTDFIGISEANKIVATVHMNTCYVKNAAHENYDTRVW